MLLTRFFTGFWHILCAFHYQTYVALDQLDLVDKDLLLNLLKDNSFVVSSEIQLYGFLKKWMIHDLARKNQQLDNIHDGAFLTTVSGEPYREIFDQLRLSSLLSYPNHVDKIFKDQIIPQEVLNRELNDMYTALIKTNNKVIPQNDHKQFRFARRMLSNQEYEFTTDFFYAGVVLKYKFNSKRIIVERLEAKNISRKSHLMNYDQVSVGTSVTLYGADAMNDRFTSEKSRTKLINLIIGKPRLFHIWRKPVMFPCIIFIELLISCGCPLVEV